VQDGLARVRAWNRHEQHDVVGVMTGTSADAVDVVLAHFSGGAVSAAAGTAPPRVIASHAAPLPHGLRAEVLAAASAGMIEPERILRLDAGLGELYAAAVLELLGTAGIEPASVGAIGLHGQTIRHIPRADGGGQAMSWQLGSAAILAERTGICVVSDFRSADTAAGGEGAPLVPLADWWLFRSNIEARILLNLGGMANLTWLPRDARLEDVIAFDTGPGNAVIDALAMTCAGTRYDADGALAASGRVDERLLGELLGDEYFARTPPRSTGRERFGAAYASRMLERARTSGVADADVVATATALTSASVADGIDRFVRPRGAVDAVYASGGGVRNRTLMEGLARRLAPTPVRTLADLGVDASAKEALAFACLAHRTLCGLPGNAPSATGASHPVVLGRITAGRHS